MSKRDYYETLEVSRDASSNELKKAILTIINEEDKKDPLSDYKIVEILSKKYDFLIARRTVSKYRRILNIKNAQKRKKK